MYKNVIILTVIYVLDLIINQFIIYYQRVYAMKTNVFNQSVYGGKFFILMPLLIIVILAFTFIGTSYATDNPVDKSKLENQMKSVQLESVDVMPYVNTQELASSIKYPEKARKMGLQGRVYVKVLVSKEGKPKDIEVS